MDKQGADVDGVAMLFDALAVEPNIFRRIINRQLQTGAGNWTPLILIVFLHMERANPPRACPVLVRCIMGQCNRYLYNAAGDDLDAQHLHCNMVQVVDIFLSYYDFTPFLQYHQWPHFPANFCKAFAAIDICMRKYVLVQSDAWWDSQFQTWTEANSRVPAQEDFYASVSLFVTASDACIQAMLARGLDM